MPDYSRMRKADLVEALGSRDAQLDFLVEAIPELEARLQEQGWDHLTIGSGEREFSRQGLRIICHLCELMYLKNPVMRRGVLLKTQYVWGQGMSLVGRHDLVNEVLQRFMDDEGNKAELTDHQARTERETELEINGNLFFTLFTNRSNGDLRVRSIPVAEVEEIYTNPEDRREPWFYLRVWTEMPFSIATGPSQGQQKKAYYPDFRFRPESKPATIGGVEVRWDAPVYHVKVGGLPNMRFGVPEIYSAVDWARAYVEFLSAWSTIQAALARFAWELTTKGGKQGVAAAKTKLGSTLNTGNGGGRETNPPPLTGSTFIGADGNHMTPIKTAGATTTPDEARRLFLMISAALGFPETFFGDVSVGTLATAKSLDRPTELMIMDRQTLWRTIYIVFGSYAIEQSAKATNGLLPGSVTMVDDREVIDLGIDEETGEPIDIHIDAVFPPVLEHSVAETVEAIVNAATLGSQELKGTLPAKLVSRLLLQALGVDQVDEILEELYPDGEEPEPDVEEAFTRALADFHEAVVTMGSGNEESIQQLRQELSVFAEARNGHHS